MKYWYFFVIKSKTEVLVSSSKPFMLAKHWPHFQGAVVVLSLTEHFTLKTIPETPP